MTEADHKTELLNAIQRREVEVAQRLIAAEPALGSARNAQGVSALMLARYMNLRPVTELILSVRPSLDLFEAAAFGDLAQLRQLLDSGKAQVNARSADGATALHFACFFAQPECAEELIKRGAELEAVAVAFGKVRPLHSAAAGRSSAILEQLLDAGADPDQRQDQGWTALHSAAQHGDLAMTRLLLQHGADLNVKSDGGQTALELARAGGHAEVVQLLEAKATAADKP